MGLVLTGLDGKNPLAFLAALGVLNVVTERSSSTIAKLAWNNVGTFRPVLVDGPDRATLLEWLIEDVTAFASEPALDLHYPKASSGALAHDLKPPPDELAKYLNRIATSRSMAFAASFFTDVVRDGSGNTKPTALHFTAGQQEFLAMVSALREGVTRDDFEEALFGPWRYARALPVLQWDNSQTRDYALRASDPSKDKKLGVPGADWLAFRALPFFSTTPIRRKGEPSLATTGCSGGWKNGTFRWPMWTAPLSARVVRSLLTSEELYTLNRANLEQRGVSMVFESAITRSDQGGYGSFSPAGIATPQEKLKRSNPRSTPQTIAPSAKRAP